MVPFSLGTYDFQEEMIVTRDGLKACQDYGWVFGVKPAAKDEKASILL